MKSDLNSGPISFKAPPPLKEWLKQKASQHYRSVSKEIILHLEAAMNAEKESNNAAH